MTCDDLTLEACRPHVPVGLGTHWPGLVLPQRAVWGPSPAGHRPVSLPEGAGRHGHGSEALDKHSDQLGRARDTETEAGAPRARVAPLPELLSSPTSTLSLSVSTEGAASDAAGPPGPPLASQPCVHVTARETELKPQGDRTSHREGGLVLTTRSKTGVGERRDPCALCGDGPSTQPLWHTARPGHPAVPLRRVYAKETTPVPPH